MPNSNYQYNMFTPYYQHIYNSQSFDENNYYQKMNEQHQQQQNYLNYQSYGYNYPSYDQQQEQQLNIISEPIRTNTPDKRIMNDSGLGISPEIIVNAAASNQIVESEEDEDDDSVIDNVPLTNHKSKDSSLMKPPKPYLEIIADAILTASDHMMQLHEIYNYMESKYAYFAQNVNKSWRNSVRHNLSLNECFVKAGRGSNGKGNYWKIHSACEPDFIRGNFRRKNFKILIRQSNSKLNQQQPPLQDKEMPTFNAFNSLAYFNNQLQSLGIENFLNNNSNSNVNYNQRSALSNHRYQPY